jgi:hypothetical protein
MVEKTISLTFVNLTPKQAKVLAQWYEGQGEQSAGIWFEEQGVDVPLTNCQRKGGYLEEDADGNLIVHCK